jgi:hypothetical protein
MEVRAASGSRGLYPDIAGHNSWPSPDPAPLNAPSDWGGGRMNFGDLFYNPYTILFKLRSTIDNVLVVTPVIIRQLIVGILCANDNDLSGMRWFVDLYKDNGATLVRENIVSGVTIFGHINFNEHDDHYQRSSSQIVWRGEEYADTIVFRFYGGTTYRQPENQVRFIGFRAIGAWVDNEQKPLEAYTRFWGVQTFENDGAKKGVNAKTGCIFQNRHFLANTFVLASHLGNYSDFGNDAQDNTAPDSPFIVMQNTFKYGRILHLVPFKQGILALSTDHEIFIYAQGLMTPSTCSQQVLGERGSEDVRPLVLEQGFIGVERGGNLYFQSFSFSNAAYERIDLSKYIKHLMVGRRIIQIEGLMASDNSVFILFDDGKMLRLYIDLAVGIIAFTRIEMNAFITNITVADEIDGKYLWAITDNNELLKFAKMTDKYPCYLDKARKFENIDMFHVEHSYEKLALCYDENGKWAEEITEGVGEVHTLQKKADVVYVGEAYTSYVETLDLAGADDNFSAHKGKVNTLVLHLVDALGVKVNGNAIKVDNLEKEYPQGFTGKYKVAYFGEYGLEKIIKISSDEPYGFTVSAINASTGGA